MVEAHDALGQRQARTRYNDEHVTRVLSSQQPVETELHGFSDLWVPIVIDGRCDNLLVSGPFLRQPWSAAEIRRSWQSLTGEKPGVANPRFLQYARTVLHTQVQGEAEVHRRIDGQNPPEPRRGIEDVPMHGGDERHAAEEEGIPLGDAPGLAEHLGAVEPEAVAGYVLVVPEQEVASQHRPAERESRSAEHGQRQELGLPRIEQILRSIRRHWASPAGTAGRARRRPAR